MYTRPFLLAAVTLLCFGCSSEKLDRPPLYKVSGVVTYKGEPVTGADITFVNEGRSAFGRTNDKGEYKLTTFSSNDGAVEGKHSVSIVQIPIVAPTAALPDVESEAYQPPGIGEATMPEGPKSTLPKKYADVASSGLVGVVNKEGDNVINFDLTD